ncbi:MAG: PAS domain-containing sensor histidine kinase [Desulfovibrio sp.]
MKSRSVFTRMLLWAWAVLAAALLALFLVTTYEAKDGILRDAEQRAKRELNTVKWLVVTHPPFADTQTFDGWAKELGSRMGLRVTFIVDGTVRADSMVPFPELGSLEDHSERPEVRKAEVNVAVTSRRHSDTLDREMIYAATLLPPVSGLPRGVLRLAVPFSELRERLSMILSRALWTMGLALAASGMLLLMGMRNLGRSVSAFVELARDIGNGDFSQRIREVPGREFQPLAEAVNAMARRIGRHVGTIEEQGGRLRAMFQGMGEGVLVLDEQGRIESFNRALEHILPDAAQGLGRSPLEAGLPLEIQDAADRGLGMRATPATATEHHGDRLRVSLETGRHLAVSVLPFTGYKGGQKLILVFRDVTPEVEHERALRDFVANASHQLRTPLTSIKGYAETLLDSPPEDREAVSKFLRIIQRNADHMDGVLSSMLKLARSDSTARSEDGPSVVDAKEILEAALADLAPRAEEAGMRIQTELPEGRLLVRAEPEGLLHVFHNLITNAMLYGGEGGIIDVCAHALPEGVAFSVRDHGPGIPSGLEDKVFERFFRGDPNAIDGRGGAGLGLAICRQIVENYGGSIRAERPEQGRGARFTFQLLRD